MGDYRELNEMVGGVYAIVCNGNGKIYIGGSENIKKGKKRTKNNIALELIF